MYTYSRWGIAQSMIVSLKGDCRMKKLLALILATLTMTSVLAGCSNGEGNSSSTPSEGSSQSSSGGVDRLEKIKSSGISGIIRPSKTAVQVIVGPKVQFVYDEMKKMI